MSSRAGNRPNIIVMNADDLGFGDVGCYGSTKIPTPNIDRLGKDGLRFTRGFATAATCTPSRYSLLTGSYPWRNESARILTGDAPLIIEPGSGTVPAMLKGAGYATGVVGKWHLGLGHGNVNWNAPIEGSPLDVGFDESFIFPATNDRVPCVYVDGRSVVGLDPDDPIEVRFQRDNPFPELPTGRENPELLRIMYSHGHDMSIVNGISRIGYMRGGKAALWKDETLADTFTAKACDFIERHQETPFFLYFAFHQPHVPRVPAPRFVGATNLGPRGDTIVELDWCVGEVLNTLERLGLREQTIVVFTSDNGPVLDDGYHDQAVQLNGEHRPAGPLRGGKYSMFDGGVCVPFLVSWPGTITPGESPALVSQVDFYASFASLVGASLGPEVAVDSFDVLDALLGRSDVGRNELVTEGSRARTVLHHGEWVFIPPNEGPAVTETTNIETGNSPVQQLYHIAGDIGQVRNVAEQRPDLVRTLSARLDEILQSRGTRTSQ